jgi:hypothetical protein
MKTTNKKTKITHLPTGFISVNDGLPPINKKVRCFMDDKTETFGYIGVVYNSPNRPSSSGWRTMYEGGWSENEIRSGIRVIGWKNI